MLCVLAATAYWGWRVQRAEQAANVLRTAIDEADGALANGDLAAAELKYEAAAKALDVLQRDDGESRRVYQLHRETVTANRLMIETLHELAELARLAQQGEAAGWEDSLRTRFRDRWIILQAPLQQGNGGTEAQCTRILYPLVAGETPMVIETEAGVYDRLIGRNPETYTVFAARIDELYYEQPPGRGVWRLTLRADDAFPWSNWKTFELVGLGGAGEDADNESKRILERQSERLGVSP